MPEEILYGILVFSMPCFVVWGAVELVLTLRDRRRATQKDPYG